MGRIRLIHWNEAEAAERAERVRRLGYDVDFDVPDGMTFMQRLQRDVPDAIVIDLDRLPSQGRDIAMNLRHRKSTRLIPILFIEGDSNKVREIRAKLPDVMHTTYVELGNALTSALKNPVADPVVPKSPMDGYSGTPLPKKLGIRENAMVALIGAPEGFQERIGDLPPGVRFRNQARGANDLFIWFVRARRELEAGLDKMISRMGDGKLWIAWHKRSSGVKTDVSQQFVRETGLAAGLVDYKICSIDETWSGLLFAKRRAD